MKIFKDYTFKWWQMGMLKLALFFFGLAIGAYWSGLFLSWAAVLFVIGLVFGVYIAFVAFKQ